MDVDILRVTKSANCPRYVGLVAMISQKDVGLDVIGR